MISILIFLCITLSTILPHQTGYDAIERNIKTVKDTFIGELWNNRDFPAADMIFDRDFLTKSVGYDAESHWEAMHGKGPASMVHHIEWWLDIIPDVQFTVTHISGSGNEVIFTWEMKGTMSGELMGIPPTGGPVIIHGSTISLFKGDKIQMNMTSIDRYGLLQQTGVVPSIPELLTGN
jgi:hypothetical protein